MPANPEKLKSVKEFSHKNIFFALARTPQGRTFVGASDFKVSEIDLKADKPELKEIGGHESYVTSLALAGNVLVSGGYDGKLNWWDIDKKTKIRTIDAHTKWIRDVKASRDGTFLISVADDMIAKIWDAKTGQLRHELRGHEAITPTYFTSMLFASAITPDGKHVATADKVGHIVLWNAETGAKVTELQTPGMYTWDPVQRRHSIGGIRSLAFSPDGSLLAVGGIGKIGNIDHLDALARIEVFEWKTGKKHWEFNGDKLKGLMNCLEFHPKNEWLLGVGGANDGLMFFFDVTAKKVIKQDKLPMHIHRAVLNPDGDGFVVAGHGKITLYEMKG
jgi:WD40 repeat protein